MPDKNPSIVISGATSTIGTALAIALRETEQNVVLLGRNAEKLKDLASQLDSPYFITDGTRIDILNQLFNEIETQVGPIISAVNCIGSLLLKPAHLITEQEWLDTLTTNLSSSFALVKAAAQRLMKTGGSVVLLSAAAADIGLPNHEAISAAKSGVNGLMRAAAATYASNNIRINCVAPGLIDTQLTQRIMKSSTSLSASLSLHPLNRVGTTRHIVNAICFLLSPENDWITGQTLNIDGGLNTLKTLHKTN